MPYVVNRAPLAQQRVSTRTFGGVIAYGGSYVERITRRRFLSTFGSYQGGGGGTGAAPELRPTAGQLWPRGKK